MIVKMPGPMNFATSPEQDALVDIARRFGQQHLAPFYQQREREGAFDRPTLREMGKLGFFGIEDTRPSPADRDKTEAALKKHGKTYEFHTYENCGHAFFAVDRPQYRVHAAVDAWKRVFAWFGKYLH